jgi:hypothetical protein
MAKYLKMAYAADLAERAKNLGSFLKNAVAIKDREIQQRR